MEIRAFHLLIFVNIYYIFDFQKLKYEKSNPTHPSFIWIIKIS